MSHSISGPVKPVLTLEATGRMLSGSEHLGVIGFYFVNATHIIIYFVDDMQAPVISLALYYKFDM